MQISKMSVLVCAVAFCAGPLLVRAEDTDAQAKMRDALRQKMATTSAQSPAPATTGNATGSVASPSMTGVKPADTDAQDKLREALRAKMAESQAQKQAQVATPATSSSPVTPSEPQQPATPKAETGTARTYGQSAPAVSLSPTVLTSSETPVAVAKPAPAPATVKPADTSLKTAEGSALNQAASAPAFNSDLPISADKQQRLNALLEQYKADQVTPQQYHEQRAKILAEP